ncbi:MAG: T9SS type A sorting domain-containing protein [Bacteroidales bacterium]|nr:T9SS type A sorting domain-containing protein [Bacteroidales bacterium]
MKKQLFILSILLFVSLLLSAQTVTISESVGWLESAYVKWQPVEGASSYNVYYSGIGVTNKKIDNQLIRSYGTYFRADVMGISAGSYTIKVAPVINGSEGTATTTDPITVLAQDRTGFAFDGGRVPGGYKADGTIKDGAVIIYITENNKNTISLNITGATTNPCVGLQNILYGIKKGKDTRPFIIRLIGNITDMTVMEGEDIVIENANNASSYITFEGVGSDAVCNGWGVRLKGATNIEVRNLGDMNCNSTAGDDFGLQQDNDHVWLHNCDMFYGNAGSDADQIKGDGALDNKGSTYITFSYNHFWDNGKASLLGLSENTTTGLYITYHHNWFDHSDSRHPRVRFYSAHVYNNYYDGNAKYGVGSTEGSSVFVEGNYFRNCKHPMMISMQGSDVWNTTTLVNDPNNMGTFSGENGGIIKAFNNTFDTSIGTNNMRFVAYGDPNAAFNIAGKISSTIDFDAYLATSRGEQVPATVKSFLGGNTYNNFDIDAALYVKNLVIDEPTVARDKSMQYAGRVDGGDLKFTFNNSVDDASYLVNNTIKTALTNYTSQLVSVQGDIITGEQTISSPANNNQTVTSGTAISSIVYTWGGIATDATVTGIPASGLTFVKDATAKTVTISGTPTATVSYSIATIGIGGTSVTASGTITVSLPSSQTISNPANKDQTVNTGIAIEPIIFTWGGDATDATVSGLPASGIDFVKDSTAKTITISGTPTATISYSIATSGNTGTSASVSGIITLSNDNGSTGELIHDFTASGKTSTIFTITGNLSTGYGSVTYAGLTLTQCLKMESSTNIAFSTIGDGTLTLVFGSTYTGTIKVDGTVFAPISGIINVPLTAGSHTIAKGSGSNYLFYIRFAYTTTAVKNTLVSDINFYPIPVINTLNISSSSSINRTDIFSLSGTLLVRIDGNQRTIDLGNLKRGSYLIKVSTELGVKNQMIIKK